jgi:hypothetical protein
LEGKKGTGKRWFGSPKIDSVKKEAIVNMKRKRKIWLVA